MPARLGACLVLLVRRGRWSLGEQTNQRRGPGGVAAPSDGGEAHAQVDAALREAEARFRVIVESGIVGVVEWEAGGAITLANDAFLRMLGYDRGDLEAGRLRFHDLTPPDYQQVTADNVRRLKETGVLPPQEKQYLHRDGRRVDVMISSATLDETRERGIALVVDISARKRLERERVRSFDRLNVLAEASKAFAACVSDLDVLLQTIARVVAEHVGDACGARVAIGEERAIDLMAAHHRDPDADALLKQLLESSPRQIAEGIHAQVVATGKPVFVPRGDPDALGSTADPHYRPYVERYRPHSVVFVPLRARGRMLGSLGVIRDLTPEPYDERDLALVVDLAERASLAIDNARLFRETQAAVRAREDLLAIVSHDLKNPVGTIRTATAALAQRMSSGNGEARRLLETVRRSTDRMERLIADLVDLASIQTGHLALQVQAHDAASLVGEAAVSNEPLAVEKGITIVRDHALGNTRVRCDRARVLQVFSNLIGNAIKFCGPGARITLRAARTESAVCFSVVDDGPGIAEGELPHIFERYWSAERHASKGSGLGLFITKGIVEAHGGRIWVESAVGAGASFHFTLPLAR